MNYRLGLDIGINSIGWAVIKDETNEIIDLGVRIFDAAENSKNGSSLALPRRMARGARRRGRRKKHRLERIRHLFVKSNLLSKDKCEELFAPEPKHQYTVNPYEIRYEALNRKLNPEELAGALYHIAKKRGFKSNKKSSSSDNEDGKIKVAVNANTTMMKEKEYRTVGEMLWKDEKFQERKRNSPGSYIGCISREQSEDEIRKIIEHQIKFNFTIPGNPDFSLNEFGQEFLEIMLSQRSFEEGPARGPYAGNQIEKMIGKCTFEKERKERRCAKACYSFEKFRALTRINNLKPTSVDGNIYPVNTKLLFEASLEKKKLTYADARNILNLDDSWTFNGIQYTGNILDSEKKAVLVEMKAYHQVKTLVEKEISKDFWKNWQMHEDFENMMNDIGEVFTLYKNDKAILEQLEKRWQSVQFPFASEHRDTLLDLNFSGYGHLSLIALQKINPHLHQGMKYDKACESAGYDFQQGKKTVKSTKLPCIPSEDIVNPVVIRALSQARKIINAVIQKFGSPVSIHLETARDISKTLQERNKIDNENRKRWEENQKFRQEITDKFGISITGDDILKYAFYEQQQGKCIYSLNPIDINRLFQPGYVEIDHILPYSRTFNNTKNNRVLVLVAQNREKKNRTPWEWFGNNPEKWRIFEEFVSSCTSLHRVKKQNLLRKKLTRDDIKDLQERSLTDTRYINRFLKGFIEDTLIFADGRKKKKVYSVNGAVTAYLRYRWGLNKYKNREDSVLHHALDAAVVACITDGMIKSISDASKMNEFYNIRVEEGYIDPDTGELVDTMYRTVREKQQFPQPTINFSKDLVKRLYGNSEETGTVFVSRMQKKSVTGQAHEETIRSIKHLGEEERYTTLYKRIEDLKSSDLDNLCCKETDPVLYEEIKSQLDSAGKITRPVCKKCRDGNPGPQVKRVKVKSTKDVSGIPINRGLAKNPEMIRVDVFTKNGKNYFIPIYYHNTKGRLPMEFKPAEKNIDSVDETYTFKFSLYHNDLIRITEKKKNEVICGYYVGYDITGAIKIKLHDCPSGDIKQLEKSGKFIRKGARTIEIEKYHVDILGGYHKIDKETRLEFK